MIGNTNLLIMPILTIIITIIIVGLLLWVINSFIPMDGKIKQILNIVVIIILIMWLLKIFGIFAGLDNVRV